MTFRVTTQVGKNAAREEFSDLHEAEKLFLEEVAEVLQSEFVGEVFLSKVDGRWVTSLARFKG